MAGFALNRSRQAAAEDTPAFGGIAERFRRAGDLDRAIALCREGLKKFPNQLSARVTLGWSLLDQGKFDQAQAELEQVLRRAPDNLAAIRGLAELHERTENSVNLSSMDGQHSWPIEPDETEAALTGLEAVDEPLLIGTNGLALDPARLEESIAEAVAFAPVAPPAPAVASFVDPALLDKLHAADGVAAGSHGVPAITGAASEVDDVIRALVGDDLPVDSTSSLAEAHGGAVARHAGVDDWADLGALKSSAHAHGTLGTTAIEPGPMAGAGSGSVEDDLAGALAELESASIGDASVLVEDSDQVDATGFTSAPSGGDAEARELAALEALVSAEIGAAAGVSDIDGAPHLLEMAAAADDLESADQIVLTDLLEQQMEASALEIEMATPPGTALPLGGSNIETDPRTLTIEQPHSDDFIREALAREEQSRADMERERLARDEQARAQVEREQLAREEEERARVAREAEEWAQLEREEEARLEQERQQLAREEEERAQLAREEEARAQAEREQLAREEEERAQLAREEEARAQAEREQLAREEEERAQLAREEEARAQAERERLAREEEERAQLAREEEARAQAERERLAREEEERAQLAREEEARAQAEREQLAREEEERAQLAREEEARAQAEREQLAREEEERAHLAREEEARAQAEREQLAREEEERALLARQEEERLAREAEEWAQLEREEEARLQAERERLAREEEEFAQLAREEEAREQAAREEAARELAAREAAAAESLAAMAARSDRAPDTSSNDQAEVEDLDLNGDAPIVWRPAPPDIASRPANGFHYEASAMPALVMTPAAHASAFAAASGPHRLDNSRSVVALERFLKKIGTRRRELASESVA